jgi:DNA-binding MarR family transcriptional regulator
MAGRDQLHQLEQLIRQLKKRVALEWNKSMYGTYTRTHVAVLELLARDGPQRASDLAEALCLSSGGVTSVTDKLVAEGLISRTRDEADRRVVMLAVTEKGKQELGRMLEVRQKFIESFFGMLPDEDARELIRIFRTMLDAVEQNQKGN